MILSSCLRRLVFWFRRPAAVCWLSFEHLVMRGSRSAETEAMRLSNSSVIFLASSARRVSRSARRSGTDRLLPRAAATFVRRISSCTWSICFMSFLTSPLLEAIRSSCACRAFSVSRSACSCSSARWPSAAKRFVLSMLAASRLPGNFATKARVVSTACWVCCTLRVRPWCLSARPPCSSLRSCSEVSTRCARFVVCHSLSSTLCRPALDSSRLIRRPCSEAPAASMRASSLQQVSRHRGAWASSAAIFLL
mmetsp:Transcript_93904/g.242624  ORF Transcript_93904/g.242624 Transcript_93904/m.242624 type:complete len:251 (-) Transcript_93904:361-1113(-)